jgi:hypothetical protein
MPEVKSLSTVGVLAVALPLRLQRYAISATTPCGGMSPCYTSIQSAVDAAASEEEVKVAAGVYSGTVGVDIGGTMFYRVVAITSASSKAVTTANWTPRTRCQRHHHRRLGTGRCVTIIGYGLVTAVFRLTGGHTGRGGRTPARMAVTAAGCSSSRPTSRCATVVAETS